MIRDLRDTYENVLLVDVGDFLWQRKLGELRAEITGKALKMMEYDALNVADGELSFGIDFLKGFAPKLRSPLVCSNIARHGDFPWQPYVIKEYKGLQVGVLGVVAPGLLNHVHMTEEGISLEDPAVSLKQLLPDIRKKANLIVLLSHLGWEPTRDLLDQVPGIDIAIVGHANARSFDPEEAGSTILLKNTVGGKHLGMVRLWLDDAKGPHRFESSLKELSADIQVYPEYTFLETEFDKKKRELARSKKRVREKDQMMEKFKDWTKLGPEEFMQKMRQEKGAREWEEIVRGVKHER